MSDLNTKNKIFPKVIPDLKIEKMNDAPFSVQLEEMPGWLVIPRVGEKLSFAFYDDPDKHYTGIHTMTCIREAVVHGIPCVQVEVDYEDAEGNTEPTYSTFLRMTQTHVSFVAEMKIQDDSFYFGSFFDDEWVKRYEIGENNIGREIQQEAKGIATINDDATITVSKEGCPDILGRYKVEIGDNSFDTVAILEVVDGMFTISYVDQSGRTVLFRRYNRFNWQTDQYKALWTEQLPNSEVLLVNNEKYVHWYDCISDYIL